MGETFKGKSTSMVVLVAVVCVSALTGLAIWLLEDVGALAVGVGAIGGLTGVAAVRRMEAPNGNGEKASG